MKLKPEPNRRAETTARHTGDEKPEAGKASLADLMTIAAKVSRTVKRPYVNHGELLYDAHGLPK